MVAPEVGSGLPSGYQRCNNPSYDRTIHRRQRNQLGYQHVHTPIMGGRRVIQNFRPLGSLPRRYVPTNGYGRWRDARARPMNCPHHMMVYQKYDPFLP